MTTLAQILNGYAINISKTGNFTQLYQTKFSITKKLERFKKSRNISQCYAITHKFELWILKILTTTHSNTFVTFCLDIQFVTLGCVIHIHNCTFCQADGNYKLMRVTLPGWNFTNLPLFVENRTKSLKFCRCYSPWCVALLGRTQPIKHVWMEHIVLCQNTSNYKQKFTCWSLLPK